MTHKTTLAIRRYSRDEKCADSLLALMDYYHASNLMCISEDQALNFLAKLESGEIKLLQE